jgi:hypothetical protein
MSGVTATDATVSFVNTNGITAVYLIEIYDGATLTSTYTQNNPTGNVTNTFTGLTASTNYTAKVTTTLGGATNVCPAVPFTTESAAAACDSGMDVAFIIDYSGSMTTIVDTVKSGIASIISTIVTESGSNDYRLGLALADEDVSSTPTYGTAVNYVALPTAQKLAIPGSVSNWSFITAVEKFQTNNTTTFQQQLAKINTSLTPIWPIGSGNPGGPEPTDIALSYIINPTALLNTFRSGVAKYVLIYTDNLPGGDNGVYDANTVASMNSLLITCQNEGIKVFVLGAGVNMTSNVTGTTVYPWRVFATATGGSYNSSYDSATVSAAIVNGCA